MLLAYFFKSQTIDRIKLRVKKAVPHLFNDPNMEAKPSLLGPRVPLIFPGGGT